MIVKLDIRVKPSFITAHKIRAKEWLHFNTTFAYPKNVISVDGFDNAVLKVPELPNGNYVWKPCFGKKSRGIALFEKVNSGIKIFPSKKTLSAQDAIYELIRIKRLSISVALEAKRHREWFAEEWIRPHERFYKFTDDIRCPPIIRVCGRSKVHFVVLSPVYFESAGISPAGWGERKYLWLDFNGVIRRTSEMDLSFANKKTHKSVVTRGLETPYYGEKIDGIKEIVEQVDREVSPKFRLIHNKCWSVDGIFDQDNRFVVIEMNSAIGTPFTGVTWKS